MTGSDEWPDVTSIAVGSRIRRQQRNEHRARRGAGSVAFAPVAVQHHYLVHGLRLSCEVSLPIPEVTAGPFDVEFRVALTADELPTARHTRTDNPDDPWCFEHWVGEHVIVEFPGWATFELGRDLVKLRRDDTDDDDDLVAHLLLDHIVPRVVALRGDLMLHASGVVGPSGKAHLFLGPSGTGKSTLATALAAAGWLLLDDDGIRLVESNGAWCAVPGYAGVRLLPDSAQAVVPHLVAQRPMSKGHPKHRYPVDGTSLRIAPAPVPIGRIHLLERSESADAPSSTALSFADGITMLIEHAFHLAEEPATITRQAFEHAADVAEAIPLHRFLAPAGLDTMSSTLTELARVDAEFG